MLIYHQFIHIKLRLSKPALWLEHEAQNNRQSGACETFFGFMSPA